MQHIMTEEQLSRFREAVVASAQSRAKAMIDEARAAQDATLAEAREKAAAELAEATKMEEAHYKSGAAGKAEQLLREKLLRYREEVTDSFFAGIEKELAEYTGTEAYQRRLEKQLAAYAKKLAGSSFTVRLRGQDMPLARALAPLCGGAVFEEDPSIRLGGMRILCGQRVYDESFDTRLVDEKEEFLSYCGLNV